LFVGNGLLQLPVIKALAILKHCAASVNREYGLNATIAEKIKQAAEEVLSFRFYIKV